MIMSSGVYCKSRDSTTVYNSIIIDRYNKSIFGDKPKSSLRNPNEDTSMDISDDTPVPEGNKWECGMNVRAPYNEDGEYYEAVIEKLENDSAVVRYLGYENEEEVKLEDLQPSQGKEAITEQIMNAEKLENGNFHCDEGDYGTKKIDWKPGMKCRAHYKKNDVYYEAVIQEIDSINRTAVVVMIGFGIPYEVSFDKMFESIPDLLRKQENCAKLYREKRAQAQEPQIGPNQSIKIPFTNFKSVDHEMLNPQNENEALACMLSSTYLSGYYAGYFDCMKNSRNK